MLKKILLLFLIIPFFSFLLKAQNLDNNITSTTTTLQLNPSRLVSDDNELSFEIFYRADDKILVSWSKSLSNNASLKIGKSPGNYSTKSISISGESFTFTPSSVQLPVGRYYVIVTTSAENTLADIQNDFNNNSSIEYSNEIQFIVESEKAPNTIGPKGEITNSVPTFEWSPIPGVPGYWIILSSTPFEIVTLPNDDVSIKGADVIWNYITAGTSVQYGEISPNSPYSSEAPPLLPNKEYNYAILNLYDLNDLSAVSAVFSGVSSFSYKQVEELEPPVLITPSDETVFYAEENIQFQWDPVEGVNGYNIYIFNRVSSFAGNEQQVDLPIWSSFTNNTSINFPARSILSKGDYLWYVIANDNSGSGSISYKNKFTYKVNISPFRIRGINITNNANLLSFEVTARSISNGVSPANPFLINNTTSFLDSLVTGTYEFTAEKDGFYDSTFVYQLKANRVTNVDIYLRPIESIVYGETRDNNNDLVNEVEVSFRNISTNEFIFTESDLEGKFSKFTPSGSYEVQANKAGYKASGAVNITVANNQLNLNSLILAQDVVTFSGKVVNDEQQPVKQALIKATSGSVVRQQNTNESGNFNFTLSSGQWNFEANKSGFVGSGITSYNFAASDVYQNQILKLVPKANQVTGFVYRVVFSDGKTGYVPFPDVTITAKPLSGQAVSAVTNINGQFELSLKSGSFTLEATKSNHTANKTLSLSLGVGETLSGISFNLVPNKSSLAGVVTTSLGTPLSGAEISTQDGETTESLPNGSYYLSVSPGSKTLTVSKTGFATPEPIVVNISGGQDLDNINFKLNENAGAISGKTTSIQQVLTDALISAVGGDKITTVRSDLFGNYILHLKPGDYVLSAQKTGFLKSEEISVTISPGQQSSNNNFDLVENSAIFNGSVKSNLEPLSNVKIELISKTGNTTYTLTTNVFGSFSASVQAGLIYNVTFTLDGYTSETIETSVLSAGSSNSINMSLNPSLSSISGFVFNDKGETIDGVEISIINVADNESLIIVPEVDGSYSTGLLQGNYITVASADGHRSDSISVSLERGQNIDDINFSLLQNFAVLSGFVKNESGNSLEGVVVNVNSKKQTATTTTGSDGSYFIAELTNDTLSITANAENYSLGEVDEFIIKDGDSKQQDFMLELQVGKISGFVLDVGSTPVADATILLAGESGFEYSTSTDNDGYYEFLALPLNNYTLEVIKSGYVTGDILSITLDENNFDRTLNVNNLLVLNASIQGVVIDNFGNLLEGVLINISGDSGAGSSVTNNRGEFIVSNLHAATYNLNVSLNGYSEIDTTVQANGGSIISLTLVKNNSSISGRVTNQLGENLVFPVNIIGVASSGEVYNTQTDAEGNFKLSDVGNNTDYILRTDIFREGYINDTTSFNLPSGSQSFNNANLTVVEKKSRVFGNAGVEQATLTLTNNSTGIQNIVFSGSSGDYEINFLPDGSYLLVPNLLGFSFTPASRQINIGAKDTVAANFVAEKNAGSIIASAQDEDGVLISGVEINILSADGGISLFGSTGEDGKAVFENLPSGSYEVRPALEGYTSIPNVRSVDVLANIEVSVNFTLKASRSFISGRVELIDNGVSGPVSDARVQLLYQSGTSFVAFSSSDGNFVFENIPPGSVSLKATSAGNNSEIVSFQLADDETISNVVLQITASVVGISGRVIYDGAGVEGVAIEAFSSSSYQVTTNSNGRFSFGDIPIRAGESDTTTLLIRMNDVNYPAKQTKLSIPSSAKGATISVPDFILPSGQLVILVTDGINPLKGANVNFSDADGNVTSIFTDETGLFRSQKLLSEGTYQFSVIKELFLKPGQSLTTVVLPDDTSSVEVELALPFRINNVDSIFADTGTEVVVSSTTPLGNYSGILHYKLISSSVFQQIELIQSDNSFSALIPALFSTEDIQYYVEINRTADNGSYTSELYTVNSFARGLLTEFEITPSLNNQIMRTGDSYSITLTVRDGLNQSINENFIGASSNGSIEWINESQDIIEILQIDSNNPTEAILNIIGNGQAKITAIAELNGKILNREILITASDVPLKNIFIGSPSNRLSNRSDGIQFSYSAIDTLDRSVLLGDNTIWGLTPEASGTITDQGTYVPVDSTYVGNSIITLYDQVSELSGTFELSVFAQVDKNSGVSLTDYQGMRLDIPAGAVEDPIEVSVGTAQFGPAKKHFASFDVNKTYTVSDDVYNIIYSGNSLPGDSLFLPASFELPQSESLEFFEGEQVIGIYDPVWKNWVTIPVNSQLQKSLVTSKFYRFGEYSILTENEPLGIKHLSVLPSPFSPVVAPVKIGYFLSTSFPPASVTIKIYNIRGEVVRTLLENDIQFPGKFGSSSSQKEIYWDGKTDNNYMARNGRYIIQVTVKDKEDEINKLIQVVLIK